ncbi:M24 family metallopeptidase [Mycoplasmopsis synoviae]|uniref:M24 family metallopeptidase n=1 Tax=Mycoplasmopsis synoviae TaxID=2109 RepID=UPI001EF7E1B8|nr:M24 family metallopeptidase [Mycoplasmopsis synoviae]ULL02575.1 aminopeptidase P family protein [Mycoplasmopsis synoviae]
MDKTRLLKLLDLHKADALVSEAPQTRLWYAKVETSDGYIVVEKDKATLFVDNRYIEYAKKTAKNVEVKLLAGDNLKNFFKEKRFKKVLLEENYLTKQLTKHLLSLMDLKEENVAWVHGQELRVVKSKEEVKTLQEVVDLSLKSYNQLMAWLRSKLDKKEKVTEKHAAAKLAYFMQINGCSKEGFDSIVATGKNAAEPHHHPTDDVIEDNEILKVDFGGLYKGFCADITRTSFLGDRAKAKDPKVLEVLQIVEEAAKAGRDAVRPGVLASDIDLVCRNYIKAKGYENYFLHSTGHGLGIDVHELPVVSFRGETVLEPGMVITVEPGIYLEGLTGARIEDDVLVTETGRRVLSRKDEN